MERASPSDRDYFRRIAASNRQLPSAQLPSSLAEMFERLEVLKQQLGQLANAGQSDCDDGDIKSHLEYLKRLRSIDHANRS